MSVPFSTSNVDYLQRTGEELGKNGGSYTTASPTNRRLLHVRGIGRPQKLLDIFYQEKWLPPTADLIAGLYGYRVPIAAVVEGGSNGVTFRLGTWSGRSGADGVVDRRLSVVSTALRSLHPLVNAGPGDAAMREWPLSGVALGIPTIKPPTRNDLTAPWDRIARAMGATKWSVLVLAHALPDDSVAGIRHGVLNEMRIVQEHAKAETAPSPLTEFYVELLKRSLNALSEGAATGIWRTACYLVGDEDSYPRLATTWRSVFAGPESLPEPVRVFDLPQAAEWTDQWSMPNDKGRPGPGAFQRTFEFQSLLTSTQLSAYVHFPQMELPGFSIDTVPAFDAVPTRRSEDQEVLVGRVVHGDTATETGYSVSKKALTRHALVCGITGGGKSTTIFQLLEQLDENEIPFLVVEPAKAEYRALLEHPTIGPKLQIFTLGDEGTSPFRINPFEVPEGVSVGEQIDVVRALMVGSFGMWTPLPQILERCLYEVYADRGWDLVNNMNARATREGHRRAAPTLSELAAKVPSVVAALGYDEKIRGDMQAALLTRLDSLRAGGKGRMLDVALSIPMDVLLSRPTVVELEGMGDEDDRAFLMGLLLIRLVQHRRKQGPVEHLAHTLVIEEAHRLLSARSGAKAGPEEADPKGKLVDMFSNLLSEIRAYGQGVVIADQVPVRLAPDVLKNTGLKIAHRTVANEDREALAGAMAMTKEQSQALTTFPAGRAAVFGDGDDSPIILQVPERKSNFLAALPDKDRVARHMHRWRSENDLDHVFYANETCVQTCQEADRECLHARRLLDDAAVRSTFSRILHSTINERGALTRLWGDLVQVVRAHTPRTLDEAKLMSSLAGHGAEWFAERRGAQAGWTYEETDLLARSARAMLIAAVREESADAASPEREEFRAVADALFRRTFDPFPACTQICGASMCRFRQPVQDIVENGDFDASWMKADAADIAGGTRDHSWELSLDAAYELVEWPGGQPDEALVDVNAGSFQAALCFAQQVVERDQRKIANSKRWTIERIVEHATKVR